MIYKQAQIDKFLKRPDNSLRAVLVYGSNEGLMAEHVKNFTKATGRMSMPTREFCLGNTAVNR